MIALITDSSGFLYHAWLASASLPPEQTKQLLDEYRTPENIFLEFKSGSKLKGIAPAGIKCLAKNASDQNLATLDGLLMQHHIRAFTSLDMEYPDALLKMQEPPAILFYQGNLQCMKRKMLAMVGSRSASYDGQRAARKIVTPNSERSSSVRRLHCKRNGGRD